MVTTLTTGYIEDFRLWLSDVERSRSPHTIKAYSTDIRMLFRELGVNSFPVVELPKQAATWLNMSRQNKLAPMTIRRRKASVVALGQCVGFEGDILKNYNLPSVGQANPHPLPGLLTDLEALLGVCVSLESRALVALLGCEGMRLHEALELPVEQIDLDKMSITIWGKGNKVRTIPITMRAFEHLAPQIINARLAGRPNLMTLSDRGSRAMITELGVKARLSRPIASHDLRATFATILYNETKDIRLVQGWLGHATITTTQGYIGLTLDQMRDAGSF